MLVVLLAALLVTGTVTGVGQRPAVAAPRHFDHVLFWNSVLLRAFRNTREARPTRSARAAAMMNAAIYDAVNSITPIGRPYLARYPLSLGTSQNLDANIDSAAFTVLTALFPTQTFAGDLAAASVDDLGGIILASTALPLNNVGLESAAGILADRAHDGSNDNTPYRASHRPGHWRETQGGAPFTPNWGHVRPFTMTSGSQFRPDGPLGFDTAPALLHSKGYAKAVREVERIGRSDSTTRSDEQTEIAFFWNNCDDGTDLPPGQLIEITRTISGQRRLGTTQNAKLFGLVGLALGDAAIVAWDRKYDTDFDVWRPETAIHLADTDDNPDTSPDRDWQPLQQHADGRHFSPAHPSYTSGHSTFAGSWAAVLRGYFGTDDISFTATTTDPHAVGVTRRFTSFSEAGREDSISRVYLGVHYRFDIDAGYDSGQRLGKYVFAHFLG